VETTKTERYTMWLERERETETERERERERERGYLYLANDMTFIYNTDISHRKLTNRFYIIKISKR